jgi:hypothetical protein
LNRREGQQQAVENRRKKRLEPTISRIDLEIDPAEREHARSAARWKTFRRELVNWLLIVSMFIVLLAGCIGAAVHFGVLQYPQDFSFVKLPSVLFIGGIAMLAFAQITCALLAFQASQAAGWLSLLIPGYVFVCIKREGTYWPVAAGWILGVCLIALGTWLLA